MYKYSSSLSSLFIFILDDRKLVKCKKKIYGVSIIKKIVDRKKITHQERQRFDNLVLHIQEHSNCKLDTTNKIKVQITSISFFFKQILIGAGKKKLHAS